MADEMKIVSFRIDYIGLTPPSQEDIEDAIEDAELDMDGICTAEEIEPAYEVCEACEGVGNCDQAAGFSLDCAECNGTGWIKITQEKKKNDKSKSNRKR